MKGGQGERSPLSIEEPLSRRMITKRAQGKALRAQHPKTFLDRYLFGEWLEGLTIDSKAHAVGSGARHLSPILLHLQSGSNTNRYHRLLELSHSQKNCSHQLGSRVFTSTRPVRDSKSGPVAFEFSEGQGRRDRISRKPIDLLNHEEPGTMRKRRTESLEEHRAPSKLGAA